MNDEEYNQFVAEAADYLCGFSCGTAVDIVLNYAGRPDLSMHHLQRLVEELTNYYNRLK